ncbi:FixH family protein [Limobrevibacterium gyesilva]|uniref:FixH family protein n=1 Tax=Limobrevibacterium gyesilva TaxID=2991712 RepID=UPI00222781EC
MLGAAALIATGFAASTVFAAARDYKFVFVSAQPTGTGKTDVTVRLVHTADNKPVPDAVIFQTRADMGPEGMPTMAVPVTAGSAQQPGLYRFQAETSMAGTWALTLSAKVQGESETVTGVVNFPAAK